MGGAIPRPDGETPPAPDAAAAPPTSCGARLPDGSPCRRAPAPGKRRCRRHGGAPGVGAPKGSRNALKHGAFTREALAERRAINDFIRACLRTMCEIEGR